EIKSAMKRISPDADVVIVEIGGTVGDIESLPFLEAIRQFRREVGREHAIFIHLTLVPYIAAAGEVKTKPTQHSVRELMEIGIMPDFLICRAEQPLSEDVKRKIALFCNVEFGAVIESVDVPTIYEIPLSFYDQGLDERVVERLGVTTREPNVDSWRDMVRRVVAPRGRVRVAVVGKYTDFVDSYKRVQEARSHGGLGDDIGVSIGSISRDRFTSQEVAREILSEYDGLRVPGGFGVRGVEGMVEVIRAARETGVPFFGICLGMQAAIVEFARNVCGLEDSDSSEFAPDCANPVVSLMESQQKVKEMGGTMRLGAYVCRLSPGTRAARAYGEAEVSERHRHRYEVSNRFRDTFEENGLVLSGLSPDGSLV